MGSALSNQQGPSGSNKPKTIWWIGLASIVVIIIVCYLFMRQPTGQMNQAVQIPTTASPKEAVLVFLAAVANGNRDAASAMMQGQVLKYPQHNQYWKKISGLKVISVGEPAVSPTNRSGWCVLCVARSKSGEMLKGNISVRNDGPGGQWQIDGIGF